MGRECRIEHQGDGIVTVQRQLSASPCILEQTWGVRGKKIWVTGGCGAVFRFVAGRPSTRLASGSAWSLGNILLAGGYGGRHPRGLTRRPGHDDCLLYRNWGHDDRSIPVAESCRAQLA